jgi:hypothetical protein
MGTYRAEWSCCGSVTETEAYVPEECPFCTESTEMQRVRKQAGIEHDAYNAAIHENIALRAEVASLKEDNERVLAANKDCFLHFETLKFDYDRLTQQLAAANGRVEVAAFALVKAANMIESDPAVTDTIWYSMSETLWDFMIRTAQEVMNGAAAIRKSEG